MENQRNKGFPASANIDQDTNLMNVSVQGHSTVGSMVVANVVHQNTYQAETRRKTEQELKSEREEVIDKLAKATKAVYRNYAKFTLPFCDIKCEMDSLYINVYCEETEDESLFSQQPQLNVPVQPVAEPELPVDSVAEPGDADADDLELREVSDIEGIDLGGIDLGGADEYFEESESEEETIEPGQVKEYRHFKMVLLDEFKKGKKRIIIKGDGGVGKSTASRKICLDFSRGDDEMCVQFRVIVQVDLKTIDLKRKDPSLLIFRAIQKVK